MRTTLTLEPDVAARLRRIQERDQIRWKDLVNQTLREGLSHRDEKDKRSERETFQTREVDLGECRYDNLNNVADVLALAEGEDHK
jgi:hypothetical protein